MIGMEVTIMAMEKERELLLSQLAEETRIRQALAAGTPAARVPWRPAPFRFVCRALDIVQPIDWRRAPVRRGQRAPRATADSRGVA